MFFCCGVQVPAIVHALLPGPIGGQAIAEVLLGVPFSVTFCLFLSLSSHVRPFFMVVIVFIIQVW